MNCKTTRHRIRVWLVFALRPQTMFHRPTGKVCSIDKVGAVTEGHREAMSKG
jgi:hypothetical protein